MRYKSSSVLQTYKVRILKAMKHWENGAMKTEIEALTEYMSHSEACIRTWDHFQKWFYYIPLDRCYVIQGSAIVLFFQSGKKRCSLLMGTKEGSADPSDMSKTTAVQHSGQSTPWLLSLDSIYDVLHELRNSQWDRRSWNLEHFLRKKIFTVKWT